MICLPGYPKSMKINDLLEAQWGDGKPPFVKTAKEFWRHVGKRRYPIVNLDGVNFLTSTDSVTGSTTKIFKTSLNSDVYLKFSFSIYSDDPVSAEWHNFSGVYHAEILDDVKFAEYLFGEMANKKELIINRLLQMYKNQRSKIEISGAISGLRKLGNHWPELDAIEKSISALNK